MFRVAARDILDVTGCVVPHPAFMSTSNDVLVVEPGDPALSPRPVASERNRRDEAPRMTDASLMAALLRQEPAAAEVLYARYASRIYGLGLVLLKNRTDAEDLVQDTFLKVWRTGSAFDPRRGSLDVWILLTARSLAIDLLRRRTLETRKLSSLPSATGVSDEPGPEWHAEQRDLIERVRKAMEGLPQRQRSAVALAYLEERSSTQVAELQGIPPGTVKSRIRAGIATLRQTLSERGSGRPPTGRRERSQAIRWSGGEGS
jgi:RNA polymerase sigma-70 factor, ECF subfamily